MTQFDKLHRGNTAPLKKKIPRPVAPVAKAAEPQLPDHIQRRVVLAKNSLSAHPIGSPGRAAAVREAEGVMGDLRKIASDNAADAAFKAAFANPKKMGAGL